MQDLKTLAADLMSLEDKLISCMKCGFCQAVCPVFGATGWEADVTRGKIALLEDLAHRILQDPAKVNEKLGRCLLCGSCQSNCPSGVSILEIFMKARGIVAVYLGLSPFKKLIFRFILPRPGLFNTLTRLGAVFQGLGLRRDDNPQGAAACSPLLAAFIGDRRVQRLPTSLNADPGPLDLPAGRSGLKVTFFPGCLGDKLYPSVAKASLKALAHHGVGVWLPAGLACCGIPALASGDRPGAVRQLRVNAELLGPGSFDHLVTPCATCASTIKEWWPRLAEDLPADQARAVRALAAKTLDISVFLVDVLKAQTPVAAKGPAAKVTYHDSCHLKKVLGVENQPRALIRLNPAYELVEMAEADRCCGCGGSFNLFHYDLSRQIGQRKRGHIVASGAVAVAAGCPACMMQITDALAQGRDPVAVKHPVEIYAEALP